MWTDGAAAPLVARSPGLVGLGPQPVGGSDRQGVERGAQRLDRAGEAGQAPHGAEDMGRVGPLPSMLGQEALLATQDEQSIEEQTLGATLHKTTSKLAQHGSVETRILQGQAQQILPVDAATDCICGASIR